MNIVCVLKTGQFQHGAYQDGYTSDAVKKLKAMCEKHIKVDRFVCLSNVDVPCERIELKHDLPGWWAKIELFREDIDLREFLFLDLDSIVLGNFDELLENKDFLMVKDFNYPHYPNSSVMWLGNVPHIIYEKFMQNSEQYIDFYYRKRKGAYVGDQAFIFDTLEHKVKYIDNVLPKKVISYKKVARQHLPDDTRLVSFHGRPKPWESGDWSQKLWESL